MDDVTKATLQRIADDGIKVPTHRHDTGAELKPEHRGCDAAYIRAMVKRRYIAAGKDVPTNLRRLYGGAR